jgi:23S rRNA pseudouridine2605 synthase
MRERLQKILSAYGVASRRASEEMLTAGRVRVNGTVAAVGQSADPGTDRIEVDGQPLNTEVDRVYIMLNKPRGYVTTMHDEKGRKNVTEIVKDCHTRVWPVGRLDMNSEGLLIMTNDGDLTNKLTHPSYEKPKSYKVRVRGDMTRAVATLSEPMTVDGVLLRPAEVKVLHRSDDGALLSITIHEGKNRQIRKMCEQALLEVLTLRRVSEGGLELGTMESGCWRYLTGAEVALLKGRAMPDPKRSPSPTKPGNIPPKAGTGFDRSRISWRKK